MPGFSQWHTFLTATSEVAGDVYLVKAAETGGTGSAASWMTMLTTTATQVSRLSHKLANLVKQEAPKAAEGVANHASSAPAVVG